MEEAVAPAAKGGSDESDEMNKKLKAQSSSDTQQEDDGSDDVLKARNSSSSSGTEEEPTSSQSSSSDDKEDNGEDTGGSSDDVDSGSNSVPSKAAAPARVDSNETDSSSSSADIVNPNYMTCFRPRFTGRITAPTPYDVLFGRGKPYQSHVGNLRLHKVVKRHKNRYVTARRHEKLSIATEVVNIIKYGGKQPTRFLKRAEDGGQYWLEVKDQIAREKVGHALRGKPRNHKKRSRHPDESIIETVPPNSTDHVQPIETPSNAGLSASQRQQSRRRRRKRERLSVQSASHDSVRKQLMERIAELDTETLASIVQQYCESVEGDGGRRASTGSTLTTVAPMASAVPGPGSLAVATAAVANLPVAFPTNMPPATLAAALAAGQDLLSPAAARSVVAPDPHLIAAILQVSQAQQSAARLAQAPQGREVREELAAAAVSADPRVLAALLQGQQANGGNTMPHLRPPYF